MACRHRIACQSLAEGSYRRRQSPKRPELRERPKNTHVEAQVKLGRCRHAMSTSHHATALPVKGTDPKPKGFCCDAPPPPGGFILSFWLCGHTFWACRATLALSSAVLQFLAFWAFISVHFGLVGLHFLAFWPCGPSFPCILALRASFPCILAFSGSASGPPPQVAKNGPFAQRPYNGFISAVTGSILQFLAFWAFISVHFGLVGLHFLAFWPCGPSFPCILALWAFISLYFGLLGLHFLSFWPFRGQLLGSPPQVAKNGPFAQRPYNGFISAVTGSILQFLAFWAFISLHFGLVGLHFLAFWPCGPSFPCILALWAFISLHFGLVDLHFLAFWPCGLSFPCILALWAFISLHFGLVGFHFLSFWPFRSPLLGSPPQVAKNGPFAQRPYNGFISAVTGSILQFLAFWAFISLHFGLVGLHFLAFWPCGPSFPCIFWPCGPLFPCILALCAFISFHFGLFGASFWGPPHKLPEMARLPNVLTMDLSALGPAPFCSF